MHRSFDESAKVEAKVVAHAVASEKWQAPALSSLVNRLAQPAGKATQSSSPLRRQLQPQDDQVYLDASSDEEEEAAQQEPPESSRDAGLSIYSAAAEPFRALLACIANAPGEKPVGCREHRQGLLLSFQVSFTKR